MGLFGGGKFANYILNNNILKLTELLEQKKYQRENCILKDIFDG